MYIDRDLLIRMYGVLEWICGEGLSPWPEGTYPDPDDLLLEVVKILGTDKGYHELFDEK